MTDLAKSSFELNEHMLRLIAQEFDIQKIVRHFAQAIEGKKLEEIENIADEIFTCYGADWIRKSLQLGEEYPDRTYEVLKEGIDTTEGNLWFPLLPQRFLEIAYLSTQGLEFLPVIENNPRRLVYKIENCQMYQAVKTECGAQIANILPCRHACLGAVRTLFDDLDFSDVLIGMEAFQHKDGACQFAVSRA